MRLFVPVCILFGIVTSLFGQTNSVIRPKSLEIDGYVARVNDRVITRGEVQGALAPLLPELYRAYQGAELEQEYEKAYAKILEDLIERALIIETFNARGTPLPDQYVDDRVRRIVAERFKGDEAMFEQMLASGKKTREEFADTIREQIVVEIMMSEHVDSRARVTPEQVRLAYEEEKERFFIPEKVKYNVIVLNKGTTPEDQEVKLNEAELIRKRLIEGADFAETARAVSEGSRAAEGGAFPWMQPKDVRPDLQEVLKTLPAGEISEIVATDTELYLVKVEARRQAGYKSFDEVRQSIKTALNARERDRLKTRWIARLREQNYVVIYD